MEPIIDASHVYIRYLLGDFRDIGLKEWTIQKVKRERRVESRWSVEDVSFTLEKGDFLGIIGANGAGKSTILKAICGILPPAKGSIQVTIYQIQIRFFSVCRRKSADCSLWQKLNFLKINSSVR